MTAIQIPSGSIKYLPSIHFIIHLTISVLISILHVVLQLDVVENAIVVKKKQLTYFRFKLQLLLKLSAVSVTHLHNYYPTSGCIHVDAILLERLNISSSDALPHHALSIYYFHDLLFTAL